MAEGQRSRGGRRSAWTAELGEAFLERVRETGDAQAAARALGHPNLFNNRIRRDPEFRRRYREASFDWARDERAAGRAARSQPVKRAAERWSEALGERFLALVRETGNARQAAISLGAPNAFNNRMKRHPEFKARVRAAAGQADARLSGAESAFPEPFGIKGKLPTDKEALGGYLRPGRKPKGEAEPVLRRNSKGRMQVTFTLEGHWTSKIECDFLARLEATGNFEACALAVGFQPASVKDRVKKWPAFARDCERALAEADVMLTYRLTAHAHALLRRPGEAEALGIEEEEAPFDPAMAMKILSHIDARKYGRSGKGRRKGPPERTFAQACDSILAKIEAIERHEKLMEAGEKREGGATPGKGGAGGGCERIEPTDPEVRPASADPPLAPPSQGGES
ncbi:MAG TPA: hypothetical protein VE891_05750 [Allosphingosinicella sp.]|nr:hypothetical protein [Allosphingosinicella sp.]